MSEDTFLGASWPTIRKDSRKAARESGEVTLMDDEESRRLGGTHRSIGT